MLDDMGDAIVFRHRGSFWEGNRRVFCLLPSLAEKQVQRNELKGEDRILREGIKYFSEDSDLGELFNELADLLDDMGKLFGKGPDARLEAPTVSHRWRRSWT